MNAQPLRIKAVITVEIDAADENVLNDHLGRLADRVEELREFHGPTSFEIKSRRVRIKPRASPPPKLGAGFEVVRLRYAG